MLLNFSLVNKILKTRYIRDDRDEFLNIDKANCVQKFFLS